MPLGAARFGLGGVDLGKLELIQTQTVSGVSSVTFTNIDQATYNVHLLTFNDLDLSNDQENLNIQFSNDGGSSFESSNYKWVHQRQIEGTGGLSVGSASATKIEINRLLGNATNETQNGYIYFYNLGDSGKFTFFTSHNTFTQGSTSTMEFGSGVYTVASTINAIQFGEGILGAFSSGTISLYGIKE